MTAHNHRTRAAAAAGILLIWSLASGATLNSDSFTYLYLGISVLLLGYLRSRALLDFLAPVPGLVALTFLYAIAAGRYVEEFGLTDHGFPVDKRLVSDYYHVCLSGVTGLVLGFLGAPIGARVLDVAPEQPADRDYYHKVMRAAIVVGLLTLPWTFHNFNFVEARSYAEQALASRIEYQSSADSGLIEVLLISSPTLVILWAAVLLMLRGPTQRQKALGAAILGAYMLTQFRSGARYYIASASLIPIVFWHYRRTAFTLRQMVLAAIVTYLAANTIPLVRHLKDPAEMVRFLSDEIARRGFNYLRPELSGELLTSTNLMREIAGVQTHEIELLHGQALYSELLGFIPRAFYPDRPLPTSERFLVSFYPGVRESGGGYGLFFFQEGYWAWGEMGVLVTMFCYGYVAQWAFWRVRGYLNQDFGALIYSGVYLSLVTSAVRTGIVLSFKAALMNFIPLLMILAVERLRPQSVVRISPPAPPEPASAEAPTP